MQQLTDLQRETLEFIRGFVRINGFAPSRPEIAKALKIKHKSGVDSRLFALERKAWIELKPGSPRYIRLLDDDLPLIVGGSVAAGEPILAEERVTARIPRSVAEAFRSQPDFFVRVEGDSLDRLGFVTGSVVGIKAQSDAENGEVIVARLGDQVTLKRYFRKDERHVELRPESTNPEHQPIQVDLEQVAFEVCGVAVGALIGDGFNGPEHENCSSEIERMTHSPQVAGKPWDSPNEEQLRVAQQLRDTPEGLHEDNVRGNLVSLLNLFDIESTYSYLTPRGPADLYLQRRRTIIETKTRGLAKDPHAPQAREDNETPFQQVERYLVSELRRDKEMYPFEKHPDHKWVGIVTDGHVWHAWLYDHEHETIVRHSLDRFVPSNADELIRRILPLISADPIGKPWIPLDPRPIFESAHDDLQTIYADLRGTNLSETKTKRDLWLDMLRTASMEPENETARDRLFVTHSFLVALARGVVQTLTEPTRDPIPSNVIGDGFVAWILATTRGRNWAAGLMDQIHSYEWRRRRGDVLRPLYERFVGERDRKVFGEFYTPDWLAGLIVEELLDDAWCTRAIAAAIADERNQARLKGIGFLDPACGSGTILYHAAQRLLDAPTLASQTTSRRAAVVARLVNGIDVHPVAAEISRATLLRALPAEPPDGKAGIRIYEGDSLLVNVDDDTSLFRPLNGEIRIVTPRGRELLLPRSFVDLPSFADDLRRLVEEAADGRSLSPDICNSVPDEDKPALKACHAAFIEIIAEEGNSVWTWYIANTTGPLRLADQKVDRILANPPWVSMADIQAEVRKRALENFAERELDLWTGGRNAPHFDIAQLFIKRARQLYLADPEQDPAAWIVKKSALRGGGWKKFREWHDPILAQSLDLEAVQPFGGGDARRCCVLFEKRQSTSLASGSQAREIRGFCRDKKPPSDMLPGPARHLVVFENVPARLPRKASAYVDNRHRPLFRQGATVTPKVLTLVKESREGQQPGEIWVTTTASNKEPWTELKPQTGNVPQHWVRGLLNSKQLLPFAILPDLPQVIIPTNGQERLEKDPENLSAFWKTLNDAYDEFRGQGRNTPETLMAQLDYNRKLSSQLSRKGKRRTLVVYPASGDLMRGSRTEPSIGIVDKSVYYFTTQSSQEAAFLTALLNAPALQRAYKECRTSGRHFDQNPWRAVPIPRYDARNPVHRELARLCTRAERIGKEWLEEGSTRYGQVAASSRIRSLLHERGIFAAIDQRVAVILPDHAKTT